MSRRLLCRLLLLLVSLSATRATDFFTLRYYGRYTERFQKVDNYPVDVCNSFMAMCVNLKKEECVKVPLEFRAPYTRIVNYSVANKRVYDPPRETDGGGFLLAKFSYLAHEREELTLWSNCQPGCEDCLNDNGTALRPITGEMCSATEADGVFSLLYNDGTGRRHTTNGCVDSVAQYYEDVEESNTKRQMITCLVVGGLFFLLGIGITCMMCRSGICTCGKDHDPASNARDAQREQDLLEMAPTANVIGKAEIEKAFPVTMTSGEPQCVICLLTVQASSPCRKLICGHVFHADCISEWWVHTARSTLECPICKRRNDEASRGESVAAQQQGAIGAPDEPAGREPTV